MILPAQTIRTSKIINPFAERTQVNSLTYGLGPSGYDIRVEQDIFLWPGRFVLASSIEHFDMPSDILGMVCDKSTWIRRGVSVHNTIIEPGWSGFLTLELKMVRFGVLRISSGDPIAQIIFQRLEKPTDIPYCGKYQYQRRGVQRAL